MKTMTLALGLCFGLAFSGTARADGASVAAVRVHNHFSFDIDSNSGIDSTTYYTCSGLEDQTKDLLKKIGAFDVSVSCLGGDGNPDTPVYMPSIEVSFDSIRLPSHGIEGEAVVAQWKAVSLRGFSDCEEVRQIMNGLVPHIEVTHLAGNQTCMSADADYSYSFSTLEPK